MMSEMYGLIYLVNPVSDKLIIENINSKIKSFSYLYLKKKEDFFGSYLRNKRNESLVKNTIQNNKYNVVVSRYLRSAVNTGAINYSPSVLDVDDLNSDIVQRGYEKIKKSLVKRILWPIYCKSIRMIEAHYLRKIDFLWFSKESDRNSLNRKNSCILPNIPLIAEGSRFINSNFINNDKVALFVGSMKHKVNVEGIDCFIKKIWPTIKTMKPDAQLRVVGTGMTDYQKENWNRFAGVQAVGFVSDIGSEYANCAFSVIPLSEGGGTKIKLIESLQYGRTCVVDKHSISGYENVLKDDEDVSIAESDETFIQKCLELYKQPEKRKKMATSGKAKVEAFFNYQVFKRIVQSTINDVINKKKYVTRRLS